MKTQRRLIARRRMTWFRRQLNLEWLELAPTDVPESMAALVKRRLEEYSIATVKRRFKLLLKLLFVVLALFSCFCWPSEFAGKYRSPDTSAN